MEDRINSLIEILNNYSIKEINKIYRDKEVELEIESFTKHPDVRWSESLKKRMIQSAKRKRISPGRMKYLDEQIKDLNSYNQDEHVKLASGDINCMIENLKNKGLANAEVYLLHIEFSDLQCLSYIESYGKYKEKWYENKLGGFESLFTSAEYWNESDSNKFNSMYEQLEIIEIEDEEYPSIFMQIRELRVFQAVKIAMQIPTIKKEINELMPNVKIEIGNHDDEFYMIR